ncbi:calreticulin-like protein [Dermatophagoides farinae]|uniref:Calreticulin n=1 Tax=Dermatophagoides farinae TaxID=6954 RepID=A0A9D4NR55_DERFA|nr:calreticulin-like protein [Dermatophagoides farinae]
MKIFVILALLGFSQTILAKIYFREDFAESDWSKRWIQSKHPNKEFGEFKWTSGKFYGDVDKDKGIQTSEDARFYALSSKFEDEAFSNEGKDLVIQYSVKHEQNIDCGGGYIKLFDCGLDQTDLHGESPYRIMFGPDICGPGTKKVHVIFNYDGKNHLINKEIRCKDDVHTHLYRLVVKPDNTYKVLIDGEVVEKGELESDWNFLPPKTIKDPDAKKPEDWDDRPKIDDPEDKKPEDWDKPEFIPDPEATKPEDWDDEMDGEWEPPQINNPEYKGEWKPKQIDNPSYKGPWVHPEIPNPEYKADPQLYLQKEICAAGFDLWQVKSGTIFDNPTKYQVEIGRVALINFGPDAGKLVAIVDIIDQNRALIDGTSSGIPRQAIQFKRLRLTKFRLRIPYGTNSRNIQKIWKENEIDKKFGETKLALRLKQQQLKSNMTDFDRFKLYKTKQRYNRIVNKKLALLKFKSKKTEKAGGGKTKGKK